MLAVVRKFKITEMVKEKRVASVHQLAEEFDVHEATIRRDLRDLEKQGVLKRTHGGVVLAQGIHSEPNVKERTSERADQKERIGKEAAKLIEEGESIILDSGTTTFQIAKNIVDMENITVVTNDINIASELRNSKGIKVLITGGFLYPESYMLNGIYTDDVLRSLHVQRAFMATPALHKTYGATHFDDEMVSAKKKMIEAAQEIVMVTDHTKIDMVSLHSFAPIKNIHKIITGKELSEERAKSFNQEGVNVVRV